MGSMPCTRRVAASVSRVIEHITLRPAVRQQAPQGTLIKHPASKVNVRLRLTLIMAKTLTITGDRCIRDDGFRGWGGAGDRGAVAWGTNVLSPV